MLLTNTASKHLLQVNQLCLIRKMGCVMRFGSVCSGIEAASVAWNSLGWQAAWLSEIEPFPCAVLNHHYPDVPNLGDMTALPSRILSGEIEAPDLFCGGTPCQAFSVAGNRQSLDDHRGNLTLTFCEIADAIDTSRAVRGEQPAIIFWENVPGVLRTKDNAFGCFLAKLAGEDGELQPSGKKWSNAGVVYGPQRTIAWRILDAQYFGVAQRRKRVFVVASARDGFDPAAVLFESEGLRRDTAPSRKAGKEVTELAGTLAANGGGLNRPAGNANELDFCVATFNKQRIGEYSAEDIGSTCSARDYKDATDLVAYNITFCDENGTRKDRLNGGLYVNETDVSNTLTNAGVGTNVLHRQTKTDVHAVAYAFDSLSSNSMKSSNPHSGCNEIDVSKTLDTSCLNPACNQGGVAINQMAVRRLTPTECERLQGFPDGYTAIPWRNKPAEDCPDGPRYKALGNSWAVPVVRWIAERIQKELNK